MKTQTPRYILLDIEGTTTEISFVHEVLFPFSKKRLKLFINENTSLPEVESSLEMTKATMTEESINNSPSMEDCCEQLIRWIEEDRKHPALKKIQGLIWKEGYDSGELKSHVYSDVVPAMKSWTKSGIRLGIYSSGSTEAQKLLFSHTTEGDLLEYISDHFDLEFGHKREKNSYSKIANRLNEKWKLEPHEVLFLSDVPEELLAAQTAGLKIAHVIRPGTSIAERIDERISSFSDLEFI